ncbi:nitric oxide reductase activation protein NorD [Intestinimonas aquisgranensis]|uniref:cobaltochelatase CobT-related protein n=1 Tax=Pseudoflavonifractor sp. An184 TaxID=1965576 RepID=UPI000B36BEC5|nr:hypothetical protein [Pseudoflavonifractor sp. An184]MCC2258488.1 nitric oxide reductase activation protein NorD [Intestinimonas aquisgranensis]OUP59298.1 hypothetical protein B5F19_00825 [Pseudoflavonifractor sp. An184]
MSHKKIKQLIAQKQSKITDRQFFTSRILAAHFADIAAAQTRRYGCRRRVKLDIMWEPKLPRLACTDNLLIHINAGNPLVTKQKGRQTRYEMVSGLFSHELGHVLYTDFLLYQSYHAFLESGKWFPEPPPLRNITERDAEADFLAFQASDPKNRELVARVSHDILNILEDGYIENRMLLDYPGILGSSLQKLRQVRFEDYSTMEDMIDQEADGGHIWLSIRSGLLSYMLWGELKYGGTLLSDERIQMVFSLLGDLDKALVSRDARDRCRTANMILIRCWSHIKDLLENIKEQADNAASEGGGSGSGDPNDLLSTLLSALAGGSEEGTGETSPVGGSPAPSEATSATGSQRAATAALAAGSADGESEEQDPEKAEAKPSGGEGGEESGEEGTEDPSADASHAESSQNGDGGLEMMPGVPGSPQQHQKVSDQEGGRIPLHDTSEVSAPDGGSTEHDDSYEGAGYTGAAADVERLLNRIAENSVTTELERQRTEELTELAQSISYGDIHDGVSKTVHRIASVSEELKEEYQSIAGDLLHISKQLQKSVLQQMQDSRRGGKQTSLLMGRRLDAHALFRTDSRVFYKNALPNEMPALCVGLLLDESGSMSWNDRATYARATAIILYDFCQALGIPITVYGHSTSRGVDLYSYAEFDAIDRDDRYRMMDISARGSNRDGAALRFVAERLVHRPEDIKLLMLVSDGQPADAGYGGTAAEEDLRGIKHEYQRKGVLFIAAAIGSDKENIERIYGDAFLDITDLTKLPVKLAGIIKRFIRY